MAAKVAAYAHRAGVTPDGIASILAAYQSAVDLRLSVLGDVFHPDLLHPARSVLILLEDARCTDALILTAAALTETEFPELRVPAHGIRSEFGEAVLRCVAGVPQSIAAADGLLEELVLLPYDVALIAVVERLDHARHLHFREPAIWNAFYRQIRDAYLPFSGRVNEGLEMRLARWADAFAKRLENRT